MQEYEKLKAAKMKESKNFFDHLLLSIFQSSITHYIKQFLQVLTCFMVTLCGQLSCTASTPVFSDLWVLPSCIPHRFLLLSYDP